MITNMYMYMYFHKTTSLKRVNGPHLVADTIIPSQYNWLQKKIKDTTSL